MEFDDLAVREDGVTATIRLDKPPANVLSLDSIREFEAAFEALDDPKRKAIVVESGNEKLFSGGVEVEDHLGEALEEMMHGFGDLFETMRALETPTVASVEGSALGGGCEIVAGCDLAVAAEGAQFGQPEINLGTFPPIAAALFPRFMGEKAAFELVMTGEEIGAERARELGLVNRVVPAEEVDAATREFVDSLTQKSGLVLGMAKDAFYDATDRADFGDALAAATEGGIEITSTDEGEEGLHAFMEDRRPEWEY